MFDHVGIHVSNGPASASFYTTLLDVLEIAPTHTGENLIEWDCFALSQTDAEHPPTSGLHIGFAAPSREHVDRFWQAGIDAGHHDDGAPGLRPHYSAEYYGAFLRDPDANSVEAARHEDTPGREVIDHLWIRVADLDASRRFYEALAPHAGIRRTAVLPDRVHFAGSGGSFALVRGTPTQHLHIAFPAATDAAVDDFHADLTSAGYRDHGAPGERAQYHPGYYGAFVLDPDGTNVELVNHNR